VNTAPSHINGVSMPFSLFTIIQDAEVHNTNPNYIIGVLGSVITALVGAIVILFKAYSKTLKEYGDKSAGALVEGTKAMEQSIEWKKSVDARLEENNKILNIIDQRTQN